MQAHPEQIKIKTSQYELLVNLNEDRLLIQLSNLAGQPKLFLLQIHNQSMPPDLKLIFGDVAILFECFRCPFEVLLPQSANDREAHIKVKAVYQFKNRAIEKQALLKLTQANISVEEQLRRKIQSLQKQLKEAAEDRVQQFYTTGDNVLGLKKQEIGKQDYKIIRVLEKLEKAKVQFDRVKKIFDNVYQSTIEAVRQAKQSLKKTEKLVYETSSIIKKIQSREEMVNEQAEISLQEISQQQEYPDIISSLEGALSDIQIELSHQISLSNAQSNAQSNSKKLKASSVSVQKSREVEEKLRVVDKRGLDCFNIKDNRIIHKQQSNIGDQIFLDYKMRIFPQPNKYINKFKVKILRSKMNNIYIGVVPLLKSKLKKSNDVICYYGQDGELWDKKPLTPKVGNGFKEGDVVQVQIKTGKIKWKVNGKVQARYKSVQFRSDSSTFLPMIELWGSGDCVEWIPQ